MIVTDQQPVSVVEDKGFRELVSALDGRYRLPSRMTITTTMLPDLFNKTMGEVKAQLEKVTTVGLTTDLWTSLTTSSFMAVTVHYWDETEGLSAKVIDCCRFTGHHTGEGIAEKLGQTIHEFNLGEKHHAVTTDNGPNVVKAVRLIDKTHIPCFAHKLNLVVTDALGAVPAIKVLRDKVAATVTLTRKSSTAKECLQECESRLQICPFKPLIQDVVTRWNSFYTMIQRFLEVKEALLLFFAKMPSENQLTPEEWELISAMVSLLEPCYNATKEMSG